MDARKIIRPRLTKKYPSGSGCPPYSTLYGAAGEILRIQLVLLDTSMKFSSSGFLCHRLSNRWQFVISAYVAQVEKYGPYTNVYSTRRSVNGLMSGRNNMVSNTDQVIAQNETNSAAFDLPTRIVRCRSGSAMLTMLKRLYTMKIGAKNIRICIRTCRKRDRNDRGFD